MSNEIKIKRTCKGVPTTAGEKRKGLMARIKALEAMLPDTVDDARPGIKKKIAEHMRVLEEMKGEHDDLVVSRAPCGQDLNPIILATPEDGDEYTHACSKCGNEFKVRRVPAVNDGA